MNRIKLLVLTFFTTVALVACGSSEPVYPTGIWGEASWTGATASTMNGKLQSLSDRIAVVRDSVIETRRTQVALRGRIQELEVTSQAGSLAGVAGQQVSAQQDDEPAWPFKSGGLVLADEVNDAFADFAFDSSNIDEFITLLGQDMDALSDRIGALEQAEGLPDGSGAAVELGAVQAVDPIEFKDGEAIVAADLDSNFAKTSATLGMIEENAAKVASWLEFEKQRLESFAGPVLDPEQYELRVQGTLDPGDFSSMTELWVRVTTAVHDDGGWNYQWLSNPVGVSQSGAYDITVDARSLEIGGVSLSPTELMDYLVPVTDPTNQVRTVTISDPLASLQMVDGITVFQRDDAGSFLSSHLLAFRIEEPEYGTTAELVFSDRPVTISGTFEESGSGESTLVGLDLVAGWNVVHWAYEPSEPDVDFYLSRAVTTEDMPSYRRLFDNLTYSSEAEPYGYSLFATHEVMDDAVQTDIYSSSRWSAAEDLFVSTPTWIDVDLAELLLVPIEQALPSSYTDTVESDTPGARFVLASIHGYDLAAVEDGALGQFDRSSGQYQAESDDGNVVLFLYADRSNTLTIEVSDPIGGVLSTPSGGLELEYGWNYLEAVPTDESLTAYELRTYLGGFSELIGPF